MNKYTVALIFAVTILSLLPHSVYAQNRGRERENTINPVTPQQFWNNERNRRDEFLSKTPEERRIMRQQVASDKKNKTPTVSITPSVTNTPSTTISPTPPLVITKIQSLWNEFWEMLKKPAPRSRSAR
ncbi:MAG: hypothetical protein WC775_04595 [Patescibacteria group bacterium]|jgi:hypothetical protein